MLSNAPRPNTKQKRPTTKRRGEPPRPMAVLAAGAAGSAHTPAPLRLPHYSGSYFFACCYRLPQPPPLPTTAAVRPSPFPPLSSLTQPTVAALEDAIFLNAARRRLWPVPHSALTAGHTAPSTGPAPVVTPRRGTSLTLTSPAVNPPRAVTAQRVRTCHGVWGATVHAVFSRCPCRTGCKKPCGALPITLTGGATIPGSQVNHNGSDWADGPLSGAHDNAATGGLPRHPQVMRAMTPADMCGHAPPPLPPPRPARQICGGDTPEGLIRLKEKRAAA